MKLTPRQTQVQVRATGAAPANRLERLDIVRGLAALAVVMFHYSVQFPVFYPAGKSAFTFTYGLFGVHLFFLVSGFVILMSLDKRNGEGFIKSRFIRLYPVFWASALLTTAVLAADQLIPSNISPSSFLINMTMLHDYSKIAPIDGAYWSLTYELGFYALMYGIFRAGWQRYIDYLPVWMVFGAAAFPFCMAYIPHPLHLLLGINAYSHLFAGGLAIYLIRTRGYSWKMVAVLAAIPLIQWQQDGPQGALIVASCVLVMLAATRPARSLGTMARPFLWLGSISYALYLTHQMIGFVALAHLQQAGFGAIESFLITLAGALLLASALTYWIEKPSARWLKRNLHWPKLVWTPKQPSAN